MKTPKIKAPTVSTNLEGVEVDAALASPDRTFRGAWQLSGKVIAVNMTIAREIHRKRLRHEREPLFEPLDNVARRLSRKKDLVGYLTESELEEYASAEVLAQKLRDVTMDPRIDAAETPEELAALSFEHLMSPAPAPGGPH